MQALTKSIAVVAVLVAAGALCGRPAAALTVPGGVEPPGSGRIADQIKCSCGPSGCTCGRAWSGYRYKNYSFGTVRPYASSGTATYRFRAR